LCLTEIVMIYILCLPEQVTIHISAYLNFGYSKKILQLF
jgi:hypothetical protein